MKQCTRWCAAQLPNTCGGNRPPTGRFAHTAGVMLNGRLSLLIGRGPVLGETKLMAGDDNENDSFNPPV
jgi:hypothetical protein